LFLSQRIFYVQRWPTEIRYDFPGRIGSMATLIILINTCLLLFRRAQTRKLDLVLFRSGYVILFLIILIQNNRFYSLREYSRENVRRTTIFTQHIETIAKTAHNYPDYPIIFESFDVMDYEPIFSVKYFLTAFGVSNDISINLNGYSNQSFDVGTSGKRLAERLEEISTEGAIEGFVPLVNINDLNGKCFNIDFSGVSSTGCQNLGKIW